MSSSSSASRPDWARKWRMSPPTVNDGPSAEISRARAEPSASTAARAAPNSSTQTGSMPLRPSPHTMRSRATPPDDETANLEPIGLADDVEHDLVGAGADAVQADVAQHPFDAVLGHVAGAAVDLDALVDDVPGRLGGEELGHGDLPHRVVAPGVGPGRAVDQLLRRFQLRGHGGDLVADGLVLADGPAEGGPVGGVGERLVEGVAGVGDAARRADEPLRLQLPHDVHEPLADLAEDGGGRHP